MADDLHIESDGTVEGTSVVLDDELRSVTDVRWNFSPHRGLMTMTVEIAAPNVEHASRRRFALTRR